MEYTHTTQNVKPDVIAKLIKIAGMFGSEYAGERASAAHSFHKIITQAGAQAEDCIPAMYKPAAPWREMLDKCIRRFNRLSKRDKDFVYNLNRQKSDPSEKQIEWLTDIYTEVANV